jgi:molecular chaperone GrpE (heat shock protein)
MRTSDKSEAVFKAFIEAQAEMGKLLKDSENPFFKSKYASLAAVLDLLKPVFEKHGIAIIQGSGESGTGIKIVTRLVHTSGQWIETDFPMPLVKQDAQGAGSASTYGRRYALKAIASLAEEDDDGQAASDEEPRRDRTEASLKPITAAQLKEVNDLFQALKADADNIQATCMKFSGNRARDTEALMKAEAARLIAKLNDKLIKEQSTV